MVLDLTDDGSPASELPGWRDRVDAITARPKDPATAATALLLRPDCHVAWASDSPRPARHEREALRTALAHWFGAAR